MKSVLCNHLWNFTKMALDSCSFIRGISRKVVWIFIDPVLIIWQETRKKSVSHKCLYLGFSDLSNGDDPIYVPATIKYETPNT